MRSKYRNPGRMKLPPHKTKIVCTIGPASRSEEVMEKLIRAGMSVARLNFSHDTTEEHEKVIRTIRSAADRLNRIVPILIDLPGPKIRVGRIEPGPLLLKKGETVLLTTGDPGGAGRQSPERTIRIPVDYERLPQSVSAGGSIYLNDGFIQLKVEKVSAGEVQCRVQMGGTLLSHKGLNLPKTRLFLDAVTDRDLEIIDFGLSAGIDIFCISFVTRSDDIVKVKEYARKKGKSVHVIAKIERLEAVKNIDEILDVADGIMVARGDLGVEAPIEEGPAIQKKLIYRANLLGRPVITATQMLESMTENVRPTRAEVTDVANAILDGTDAVMLSEETAIGEYPVEAVRIMARIASNIETQRGVVRFSGESQFLRRDMDRTKISVEDAISLNVIEAARVLKVKYILTPTHTGSTPRRISRFKPSCWVLAFCRDERTRDFLYLSYGTYPFLGHLAEGHEALTKFLKEETLAKKGDRIVLAEMVAPGQLGGIDRMGILTLS